MLTWGLPLGRPENRLAVRLLGWSNLALTRLYHHVKVRSPAALPGVGPAIFVCNHTSGLDPLLIQSCSERLITWMMAKEYYDMKSLGWIYRTVEAIPVERSGRDMAATRAALRALRNGRILGIFPEGKIETSRELLPFQTGVALMAIKANVPVYPAYLDGTQRGKEMLPAILTPNRATIALAPRSNSIEGRPSRADLEQATEKIRDAVNLLADPVHHV